MYVIFKKNKTHFQGDVELKPGKNFGIHSLGRKRSLVINKCTPEDSGTYICRTTDDNTSAKLTVHGKYYSSHRAHKSGLLFKVQIRCKISQCVTPLKMFPCSQRHQDNQETGGRGGDGEGKCCICL